MLYYLFNYLDQHNFPGAGVFNYVTFRAAMAIILALVISVWFGNWFIKMLKRKKITETQRDESIDPYNTKKVGVPTMGGVIIIVSILIPVLLVSKLHSIYTILMIITTLILGIIGFSDDYVKTFKHKKDGLKPIVKLGGQVLLGLIVGLTLRFSPDVKIIVKENQKEIVADKTDTESSQATTTIINDHDADFSNLLLEEALGGQEAEGKKIDMKSTRTTVPFVKSHDLNYADLFRWAGPRWMYNLAWVFLVLLTIFIVAAVSNGSNLNDGMDGMASGNSAIIGLTLLLLAYISSNVKMADYLDLMFIPGCEELVVFLAAFVGALIGFLWFNSFPAQIFMGDTGSLTIGGIIAVSAIIMHKELLLPLLCGVFLFEILSDLDVKRFVKTGKKHRVWKKGPLHDHFRTSYSDFKKAWPNSTVTFKGHGEGHDIVHHEVKITIRFWIVTILLAAFTLITFKIR